MEQDAVPELCMEKAACHTVHLPNQKPAMHQTLTFLVSLVPHFQTKCQVWSFIFWYKAVMRKKKELFWGHGIRVVDTAFEI